MNDRNGQELQVQLTPEVQRGVYANQMISPLPQYQFSDNQPI